MPAGYTNRLLGSPSQRIDRQGSIFGNGKGFQPMPQAEMRAQGRIPVVGGVFARQPFLGALPQLSRSSSQPTQLQPTAQPQAFRPQMAQPQRGSATPVDGGGKPPDGDKPGRRLAWGRMKKLEAHELSVYLTEIADRMRKAGIPPGIVTQIKDKLDTFVTTAPPAGEVEISEAEAQALNEAILDLETTEQQSGSGIKTSTVLVVAGLGLVAALLLS